MSVFSKIRRSRQSAKEHQQKEADKAKAEAEQAPYRHVPTHAASDALAGAPPSWKHDDRDRIVEQNRRRSAMAASGRDARIHGPPSITGIPRVASSLSYVSYPSTHANPAGSMPRAYSYSGVPPMPPWDRSSMDMMYGTPDRIAPSIKGKEVDRRPYDSGRHSSASSKGKSNLDCSRILYDRTIAETAFCSQGSPLGSSGDSSSSQDDLEIRPAIHRHSTMPPQSVGMSPLHQTPPSRPVAHRLHPSSRRTSDASERGGDPAVMARAAAASSFDRRPPAAMLTRGYGPLPAVNPLPPVQLPGGFGIDHSAVASSAASTSSQQSQGTAQASFGSFNFGTSSTAPSSAMDSAPTSIKSSVSISSQATPTAAPKYEPTWEATPAPETTSSGPGKERRISKSKLTRFTELETIDSNVEHPALVQSWSPSSHTTAPPVRTPKDEEVQTSKTVKAQGTLEQVPEASAAPTKGRRLSKQPPGGAKLSKKSRWSSRGSAVAV